MHEVALDLLMLLAGIWLAAITLVKVACFFAVALRMGLPPREALTVGVGMCGRAEMAFIIALPRWTVAPYRRSSSKQLNPWRDAYTPGDIGSCTPQSGMSLNLRPLVEARALVANGPGEDDALWIQVAISQPLDSPERKYH